MKKIIFSIIAVLLLNFSIIAENSKICDNGHKNPTNAKFCVFCGLKLSDTISPEKKAEPPKIKPEPASKAAATLPKKIICDNCGKVYTDQAPKFCTNCGERLSKDRNIEQQPAVRQQQQQRQQSTTASTETPATTTAAVEQEKTINTQQTTEKKETNADISDKKTEQVAEKKQEETEYEKLLKKGKEAYMDKYYQIALEYFKQAIKINPQGLDALYNAGVISYYLKNYAESSEYFEKIISINNKDLDALIFNGLSLYKLGLKEEAKNNFKKIILLADKNSEHYQKATEFFNKIQ